MNSLRARGLKIFATIFPGLWLTASLAIADTNVTTVIVQIVPNSSYGLVSPNYNNQALTNGKPYTMTAMAKASFTFMGWSFTDSNNNPHTNSRARLTFTNGLAFTAYFADRQKPSLTVTTPSNSSALSNAAITITGTAKDNDAVANLYYQFNNQGWSTVSSGNNYNNWWATLTLAPNTNTLLVYAVDRSGNCSATNKLKLTYSAAPTSLSGMAMIVTTNLTDPFFAASFGASSFSDNTGVGSYTYRKTGPVAGQLSLKYAAPPQAVMPKNLVLAVQFSATNSGVFTNGDSFSLIAAPALAPTSLASANIFLTYSDGTHQSQLTFLTPPVVVDNGHLFNVANPLAISLATPYPGNISDRVKVTFTHLQYINGVWTAVTPQDFVGTVIATNLTPTNTVTILFDRPSFISKSDMFGPTAGNILNILTYGFADYSGGDLVTNGSGTFTYTNYGPIGAILQLTPPGFTNYYLLTFTNQADTNATVAGIFNVEAYATGSGFLGADSGSFAILQPPVISTQPHNAGVTNGGTAVFSVTASGTQPLVYQWQLSANGTNNWSDLADGTTFWGSVITGSDSNTLTIASATVNDIGSYRVIVANDLGSMTSSPALLSFSQPPQIITPPANAFSTNGGTATFNVAAAGSLPLAYHWRMNGTNLTDGITSWSSMVAGSVTTNLTISAVSTNDAGFYQVVVTNNFGSVTSPAVLLILTQ